MVIQLKNSKAVIEKSYFCLLTFNLYLLEIQK